MDKERGKFLGEKGPKTFYYWSRYSSNPISWDYSWIRLDLSKCYL